MSTAELLRNIHLHPTTLHVHIDPHGSDPFTFLARYAADPANRDKLREVQHVIISGEPTARSSDCNVLQCAVLDWAMVMDLVRHTLRLQALTLYRVQWRTWWRTAREAEGNHLLLHSILGGLPFFARFTMEETCFALVPSAAYRVELPPLRSAPGLQELHLHKVAFSAWGQRKRYSQWKIPKVCVRFPDEYTMSFLQYVTTTTHLEIWNIDDTLILYMLETIVTQNRNYLEVLVLGVSMEASAPNEYELPNFLAALRCTKLHTMVLAVTGFHRTPRKAQAKHQGNEDDYENDFTVGQANHIMRIVLAFFTVLPPSLRTVRLVLHATGKITKEQAVSLRLNIGRMMWFELGKRLWGAPKLECIALHITGVDDGCIWDDEETGTAIWVREALIEGAYSPTNVQRTCPTFMAFQDIPQTYTFSPTIPIPFSF